MNNEPLLKAMKWKSDRDHCLTLWLIIKYNNTDDRLLHPDGSKETLLIWVGLPEQLQQLHSNIVDDGCDPRWLPWVILQYWLYEFIYLQTDETICQGSIVYNLIV